MSFPVSVPANSSRFFSSLEEAKSQPRALVRLSSFVGPGNEGYLFNREFDATKIRYDSSYCTDNQFHEEISWINIKNFLKQLKDDFPHFQVIDIGCGQGEIVSKCQEVGINSIGFDPTLRRPSPNLVKQYYTAEALRAHEVYDSTARHIFVMRCVLPHIANPLEFINDLFNEFPDCIVYFEFKILATL